MRRPTRAPRALRVAAVLLGGVLAVSATGTGIAEVPEPPLVVDVDARDGQVRLEPATQAVTNSHVSWLLTNGGPDPLTFQLAVHAVDTTDDGVDIGERLPVALERDTVTLGPSEAARIPVHLDDATPAALALVAETTGAEPTTSVAGLALVGDGNRVQPRVRGADASRGVLTIRLDADGPALVDLALRASVWPGVVRASEVVEGVYVPEGGRDLEVAVDGPLLGRVTIEVAVGGVETTRASAAVWWWPPGVVVALAGALALGAAAVVVVRRRRG